MNKIFCQALSFAEGKHDDEETSGSDGECPWKLLLLTSSGFFSALAPHLCAVSELCLAYEDFDLLRKSPTFPLATHIAFDGSRIFVAEMRQILAEVEYVRVLTVSLGNFWFDPISWSTEVTELIDSLPWLIKVHLQPHEMLLPIVKHLLRHKTESVRRHAACQIRDDTEHNFFGSDEDYGTVGNLLEVLRNDMIPHLLDKPGETDAFNVDALDAVRQVLVHADVQRSDVRPLTDRFLNMIDPDAGNRTPVLHSAGACLYTLIVTNTTEIPGSYQRRLLRGAREAGFVARIALALRSVAQETVPLVAQNLDAANDDVVRRKREEAEMRRRREELLQEIQQKKKTRRKIIDIGVDSESSDPDVAKDNGIEYLKKHEHDANPLFFVDLEVRFVANIVLSLAWFMNVLPVGTDKLEQFEQQHNGIVDSLVSIINNDAFFQYIGSRPQLEQVQRLGSGIRAGIWRVLAAFSGACPEAMLQRGIPQQAMVVSRSWHSQFEASWTSLVHVHGGAEDDNQVLPHWALVSAPLSVVTALMHIPHRRIEHVAPDDASDGEMSDFGEEDFRATSRVRNGVINQQAKNITSDEKAALQARSLLLFGKGRDEFNIGPVLRSALQSFTRFSFSAHPRVPHMDHVLARHDARLARAGVATAMHVAGFSDILFHFAFCLRFEKEHGHEGEVEQIVGRRGREPTFLVEPGSPRPVARFFMEHEQLIGRVVEKLVVGDSSDFGKHIETVMTDLRWGGDDDEDDGRCPECGEYH